jgi:hypothetical protein
MHSGFADRCVSPLPLRPGIAILKWGRMAFCGGLATRLFLASACRVLGAISHRKADYQSAAECHSAPLGFRRS